jgi:hypothetical protein
MSKFEAGNEIWVLERDGDEPYDIVGVTYLATVGEYVITCPQFYGLDSLEEVMEQFAEETQDNSCLDMSVYPLCDCFATREQASAELERQGGI